MDPIIVGSVRLSHGNLINVFLSELRKRDKAAAQVFSKSADFASWKRNGGWDLASMLESDLCESLDRVAPQGMYFGFAPDAQYESAEYGFWPVPVGVTLQAKPRF